MSNDGKNDGKFKKVRGFDVWLLVAKTNLKVHRAMNKRLSEIGLSLPQHEILMVTFFQPGATQKEVSDNLLAVKSSVSAHIAKLEKRGLIVRKVDEKDSRINRLSLSKKAEALVIKSLEIQNSIVSSMVNSVSKDELQMLEKLMIRANVVLDDIIDS